MTKNRDGSRVAYFDTGVDEPGFYELEGDVDVDDNGVEHHTQMTPGKRVYPDGEGWSDTEVANKGGDE